MKNKYMFHLYCKFIKIRKLFALKTKLRNTLFLLKNITFKKFKSAVIKSLNFKTKSYVLT